MNKVFYLSVFSFIFCFTGLSSAEDPFVFQHRLSKLPPSKRLVELKKELNPRKTISAKDVDNWQRGTQFEKCLQDESQYLGLEKLVIEPMQEAWKQGDEEKINQLVKGTFKWINSKSFKERLKTNGLSLFRSKQGHPTVANYRQSFLTEYNKIEDVELHGVFYRINSKDRSESNLNFNKVTMVLNFDVRGLSKTNKRMNDRGSLEVLVEKVGSQWKITDNKFLKSERVVSHREPAFINKTVARGLDKVRIHERSEAIRRGGYTVVVDDLNNDGELDLFSGSAQESQLFLGNGKGKWVAENSELNNYKAVKTAVFADFDNDGDKDTVMTLFEYDKDASDVVYLKNEEGKYSKVKNFIKGKLKYNLPMPAAVADFNNDGQLDFYVGFPGKQDFTTLDSSSNTKGEPEGLFTNMGQSNKSEVFKDVTKTFWRDRGLSQYTSLFPHSSIASDYDFDGDADLLIVDDRSNLSPIYENQDGKKFSMVNDAVNFQNKGYGMGVAVGDLNNDGVNEIALTNVNFHARERFHASCNENWYFDMPKDPGLRLFGGKKSKVDGKVSFAEVTQAAGLENIGEGGAGVEFIDYNNDGLMDIYVANGLWSGEDRSKRHDLSSLFVRAVAAKKTFNDVLAPNRNYRQKDFSFISILRDPEMPVTKSMAGFQRNRLFLNLGNMEFVEVGYLEGVDSINDGYIIAKADVNKDGQLDIILRNGDPGTLKYKFPTIEYFENGSAIKGNSIILSLQGTESNKEAIGAIARVTTMDDQLLVRQLVANNGPSQSERILHFGLGSESSVKSLTIQWPSGKEQKFGPMEKGRYKIVEGRNEKIAKVD